jgi:hypothetical protein
VRVIIPELDFGPMLKGVEIVWFHEECSVKEIMGDETT